MSSHNSTSSGTGDSSSSGSTSSKAASTSPHGTSTSSPTGKTTTTPTSPTGGTSSSSRKTSSSLHSGTSLGNTTANLGGTGTSGTGTNVSQLPALNSNSPTTHVAVSNNHTLVAGVAGGVGGLVALLAVLLCFTVFRARSRRRQLAAQNRLSGTGDQFLMAERDSESRADSRLGGVAAAQKYRYSDTPGTPGTPNAASGWGQMPPPMAVPTTPPPPGNYAGVGGAKAPHYSVRGRESLYTEVEPVGFSTDRAWQQTHFAEVDALPASRPAPMIGVVPPTPNTATYDAQASGSGSGLPSQPPEKRNSTSTVGSAYSSNSATRVNAGEGVPRPISEYGLAYDGVDEPEELEYADYPHVPPGVVSPPPAHKNLQQRNSTSDASSSKQSPTADWTGMPLP